jgi:oxygen-independent coproporphyrinogen III oxidase
MPSRNAPLCVALMTRPIHHLYFHIPFCHRICPYCSFYKHTPGGSDVPAFLQAMVREAVAARRRWDLESVQTVYFGGGTPTFPSTRALETFLRDLRAALPLDSLREWTMEANPRTFDREKIRVLRDSGVTRISLGVQSWDPTTLATLGRDHSPAEAEQAYHILREAEIPHVNLDLMFAIPGQSLATWEATLRQTATLQPDGVSAYNLNYEEDTEFFDRLQAGEFADDPDQGAEFFLRATALLSEAGLEPYEVSNYARPGHESVHNQAYWAGNDYLGFGPGAVSTAHGRRWKNVPDTALYTTLAGAGEALEREIEPITPTIWRQERIALLARTRTGVPLALLDEIGHAALPALVEAGYGTVDATHFIPSAQGRLIADSVALTLWG